MGNCYGFIKFMYPLDLSLYTEANTPWLSFDKQIIKCKVVDIYDGVNVYVFFF